MNVSLNKILILLSLFSLSEIMIKKITVTEIIKSGMKGPRIVKLGIRKNKSNKPLASFFL